MRLKYQLFISLLCVSAILIVLMYVFSNWSFNRGFLTYLNNVEEQRLNAVADELSDEYQLANGWSRLRSDESRWRAINRQFARFGGEQRRRQNDKRRQGQQSESSAEPRNSNSGGEGRGSPNGPPRGPRLILADSDKQILIGSRRQSKKIIWRRQSKKIIWKPILVNDVRVGFVGMPSRDSLSDELDQLFAAQQARSYRSAALAMVLVSALLAILLSSRIVKPIVRIQRAVSDISGGDFSHRVEATRRDELGELSRDINQLAFTLQENLTQRQQWLAEISHELRTPVAVLQGEIEAMQDGITQVDETAIGSLHVETLRLSRLINDLQELSASDVGSLNYRMIDLDLAELVQSRLNAGHSMLDDKNIEVVFNNNLKSSKCVGDEQRLGQLFDNLLQNSARYTNAGGKLVVSLSQDDGQLKLDWQDSSPGVQDDQLPFLFDSLYRTEESRSRETGGSGLGLSIAKKIADAHQATIEAGHSELGGLCITVRLPAMGGLAS